MFPLCLYACLCKALFYLGLFILLTQIILLICHFFQSLFQTSESIQMKISINLYLYILLQFLGRLQTQRLPWIVTTPLAAFPRPPPAWISKPSLMQLIGIKTITITITGIKTITITITNCLAF